MTVHLISFDIPYPPLYGGIIDVYNKLIHFKKCGVKVILHCFQYNNKQEVAELNELCEKVYYYKRGSFFKSIYKLVPYIIDSRQSNDLLTNLNLDEYPILFEGLHTCYYLAHPSLKHRKKIVWMHNIESDYYHHLGEAEKNIFRKIYFNTESAKLKHYEGVLKYATWVVGVSRNDAKYLSETYGNGTYIPAFHMNETIQSKLGKGEYIMYHGSLDVVENHQAAMWIVEKIASKSPYKFIIAGKNPKSTLINSILKYPNIELKANVTNEEMLEMILHAQVHILPTFQDTGIKHKLLNALHKGRFIIANDKMVANTGMESLCIVKNTSDEMIASINELMQKSFDQAEMDKRKMILDVEFNNEVNMQKLLALFQ